MKKKLSKLAKDKANPASRYWRNKADAAWRTRVLALDRGVCAICGSDRLVNVHHLFDRSRKDTRHLVGNGISLCPKHHKYDRECSAHRGPVGFFAWMMRERPGMWGWLKTWLIVPVGCDPDYKARYVELSNAT